MDNLLNKTNEELDKILESLEKLQDMKDNNKLSFCDWEYYPKQNQIRNDVLKAVRTGEGPRIYAIFGGNRPLAYGTEVMMACGGVKKIEDIKIGDRIIGYDEDRDIGIPVTVSDIPFDGECESVIAITGNKQVIEASEDHCFPISLSGYKRKGKRYSKREIKELLNVELRHKFIKPKYIEYDSGDIPFSGLLLGLFLGDGSYGRQYDKEKIGSHIAVNFANTNYAIQELFLNEARKAYPNGKFHIYPTDICRIHVSRCNFQKNLDELGLTNKHAHEKFIPDIFKYSDIETRKQIIRGMILTDGCSDDRKTSIYSCSKRMLEDANEILISLGIYGSIYKSKKPEKETHNQMYVLQLSNNLINELGIDLLYKNRKSTISIQRRDLQIKKIESSGIKKCRCITVDHESHMFVLGNGIVTYNSSKSVTGASIVAELFSEDYNKSIYCATESDMSIKVQQTILNEWIPVNSIDEGDFNPSRGWKNNLIISNTGSKIWFKTYSQERKSFQGATLDLVWLDEECAWDIFQECLARVMDRNGVILFTFTSLMGFTRLVNFLYDEGNEDIKLYMMTMLENPYVSKQAKDNYLKTCDPDEIDSRVYGRPKLISGLVYKEFDEIHIVDPFNYIKLWRDDPKRYKIYEGIDPHLKTPHRWLRFLYDTKNDILYVVEEIIAPHESMLISEFSKLIKHKRQKISPSWCEIDTSSQVPIPMRGYGEDIDEHVTIRTEFAKAGITTMLCMKDNAVGIGAVKERLRHYDTDKVSVKPRLYVFHGCSGVINEFRRYEWASHISSKVSERNEELNTVKKKNDHFMDIIKYCCIRLSQGSCADIDIKTPYIGRS